MRNLIQRIKDYAREHYEEDGWDFVIETMMDEDIATFLLERGATTEEAAIKAMAEQCKLWDEHRTDILEEIF